jgi:hypothetical protein
LAHSVVALLCSNTSAIEAWRTLEWRRMGSRHNPLQRNPSSFKAAIQAAKKVAANVPRFSFVVQLKLLVAFAS